MYHLIKKDILMQKKTLRLSLLLMLFFTFTLSPNGIGGLVVTCLAITYMLVLGALAQEDKNNSDVMLISLPICRRTIVTAKYVSIYVYVLFALSVNALISAVIIPLTGGALGYSFSVEAVVAVLVSSTLLYSISMPLIFKLGYLRSKALNYVILFGFSFGLTLVVSKLVPVEKLEWVQSISTLHLLLLSLLPVGILLIVSYRLSLTFYNNREF